MRLVVRFSKSLNARARGEIIYNCRHCAGTIDHLMRASLPPNELIDDEERARDVRIWNTAHLPD